MIKFNNFTFRRQITVATVPTAIAPTSARILRLTWSTEKVASKIKIKSSSYH